MTHMQELLEDPDPSKNIKHVTDEIRRCGTLMDAHSAVRLYERTDEEYLPANRDEEYVPGEEAAPEYLEEINFEEMSTNEDAHGNMVLETYVASQTAHHF